MFDHEEHLVRPPWRQLKDCWIGEYIPREAGIYRIRRQGQENLDYVGQTGKGTMTLRKRLSMLKGVFGSQMPYRDPHTAGPALWALRHQYGVPFEVSVTTVDGSTPWRKGLEALVISLHRAKYGSSPTVNFGRMPDGYVMSSPNNRRVVMAGKRFRGGPTTKSDSSHLPGIGPRGELKGHPQGAAWCHHDWSRWHSLSALPKELRTGRKGLYRIRETEGEGLLYIGEGRVRERLIAHSRKKSNTAHPQGRVFSKATGLEGSWTLNETWHSHQRQELESDLIAAYLLETGSIPKAQFLG